MFVKRTGIMLLFLLSFFQIPTSLAALNLIKNKANKTDVRSNKIVGGYRCPITKVPFLVSLRYLNDHQHFCGGSLLSEFWILSALHCLDKRCQETIKVIAGSSYATNPKKNPDNEAIQFSTIAQCYFYPIVDNVKFDIALARLRKPIWKTNNVAYVPLPFDLPNENKSLVEICSNATVAGWGVQYVTNQNFQPVSYPVAEHDPHLHCIHLPVITNEKCNVKSNTTILSTYFCTYQRMTSPCSADSGSPLTCNGYQYGLVAYGYGCGFNQYPGVYTNILYFKNFILTTMKSSFTMKKSSANAICFHTELIVVLVILVSK